MMRLAYVTQVGFDEPGAESTHAMEVIRHLVAQGIHVTVLHPGRVAGLVRALGAEERKAPLIRQYMLRRAWFQVWLYGFLRRHSVEFDALYVRQAAFMIAPALARRRFGIPVVAEFNTSFGTTEKATSVPFLRYLLHRIEATALAECDHVVVISSSLKNIIIEQYGTPIDRIHIVHNGTNLDMMRPLPKGQCRRALGLPDDVFIIVFVGHLHPWQGIDQLIQAFAKLDPTSGPPAHLVIAGTSTYQSTYEERALLLGVGDRVHFLGAVPHEAVPQIISAADVAVAPGDPSGSMSYRIRSPLKVYEYLGCGRPVVAGDLETLRELFAGERVGFLVSPGSVPELVIALERLRGAPQLAAHMGSNARGLAERSLSWTHVAQRLVGFLEAATATRSVGITRHHRSQVTR